MDKKVYQVILGSASPRRKELMQHTFLNYQIVTSDLDEVSKCSNPVDIVQDLAFQKAKDVFSKVDGSKNPFVIGADTIVVIDNKILGKPTSKEKAGDMLLKLSNRTHQVLTGVAFIWDQNEFTFYECTEVTFGNITNDLLDFYLSTGESMDKAGAYGIQGAALGFIENVKGSYSNVVGLPVDKVILNLKSIFTSVDDNLGEWRKRFC